MITRRIRLAGHAVAAVLIAGVAVVATGAGAGAASGAAGRPGTYGGDATAASIEFRVDRNPEALPVVDPFHDWVPYAETSIDSSGGADGVASSVYPGQGFIKGPDALCLLEPKFCQPLPGGQFPDYPDWAHAQYPAHKDDSAQLSQKPFPGTGPFEVTPNNVVAHADPNHVEATAVTSRAGFANVITVNSSTSHSVQQFQGSTLVLSAEAVLKGIDIGGQLHINEIRSTATARIDGSHMSAGSANTTISGASVAGQAVAIDSKGIHAAGQGDNGQVQQLVNKALSNLASQGIKVHSLGTQKLVKTTKVQATTNGLLLTFQTPVKLPSGIPVVGTQADGDYFGVLTIGGAGVSAFAGPAQTFSTGVQIPTTPVTGGGNPPVASAGQNLPPASTQTGTGPTSTQQPAVAGNPSKPAALPIDLTNKRLKTLALVLLGYPLLLLIAAPFRAPARLPRAG